MSIRSDEGASAVEYGLLVFGIAAIIAVVVYALGLVVRDTYSGTCEDFDSAASTSVTC